MQTRKKAIVVLAPENLTADNPTTDEFGANDWLIDEMFEAYQEDPESVDESWQRFFAGRGANGRSAAAPDGATPVTSLADGPASEKAVPPAKAAEEATPRPPSSRRRLPSNGPSPEDAPEARLDRHSPR